MASNRSESENVSKALTISPQGPFSFDNPDSVIRAVINGIGPSISMEESLRTCSGMDGS